MLSCKSYFQDSENPNFFVDHNILAYACFYQNDNLVVVITEKTIFIDTGLDYC